MSPQRIICEKLWVVFTLATRAEIVAAAVGACLAPEGRARWAPGGITKARLAKEKV